MKTLQFLKRSKYCFLATPEGWGIAIENFHAKKTNDLLITFRRTQNKSAHVISNGKQLLAVSNTIDFIHEEPNWLFLDTVGYEHPYKLEWVSMFVPTPFLGWWYKRVKKFLYPFENLKDHLWWLDDPQVRIQFSKPRLILMDGEYIFEPLHPLY